MRKEKCAMSDFDDVVGKIWSYLDIALFAQFWAILSCDCLHSSVGARNLL